MSRQQRGEADVGGGIFAIAESDPELSGNGGSELTTLGSDSSAILVVGDSGSGKSTCIQTFLKPNTTKEPKSTFALEYNFARRKGAGAGKSLVHLWELGGDIYEPKLLEVPLSQRNLPLASVIIVCDLSKPQNVLSSLLKWLALIRELVTKRVAELAASADGAASAAAAALRDSSSALFTGHADSSRVRPCEIPIYIIANKLDAFRSVPSADRRALMQVIRFVAHYNGASVLATSYTADQKESFRSYMNNVCFMTRSSSSCETSADRPVNVSAGRDSFTSILIGDDDHGGSRSKLASSEADMALYLSAHGLSKDCWHRLADVCKNTFGEPQTAPSLASAAGDGSIEGGGESSAAGGGGEYPEAEVDEMRAQRDEALGRYMLEVERKEYLSKREAAADERAAAASSGGGGGSSSSNSEGGERDEGKDGGEGSSSARRKARK